MSYRSPLQRTLDRRRRRLGRATKRLSRMGLHEFLEKGIGGFARGGPVLNVGAGGTIGEAVERAAVAIAAPLVTIDADAQRGPGVVADAVRLPFADGAFEGVVCAEVLEHLSRPRLALGEIRRVLRPGGHLLLTTRFLFPLHDRPNDFFRFTRHGLELLLADFARVSIREQHDWGQTLAVLIMRLVKEDRPWAPLWASPLYAVGRCVEWLAGGLARRLPTDAITSGYFVSARKDR